MHKFRYAADCILIVAMTLLFNYFELSPWRWLSSWFHDLARLF
jgi:hypothetical protein